MERTRATSTNILELKTVQLTVPVGSKPMFRGHIFPDLLVDSTSLKKNMEQHRISIKPIHQKLRIGCNKCSSLDQLYNLLYFQTMRMSPLPQKLLVHLIFPPVSSVWQPVSCKIFSVTRKNHSYSIAAVLHSEHSTCRINIFRQQ